jgi:hypothetical protein
LLIHNVFCKSVKKNNTFGFLWRFPLKKGLKTIQ